MLFHGLHQILERILIHGDIRIPRHPQGLAILDGIAVEDAWQMHAHHVLENHEGVVPVAGWHPEEARRHAGGDMDDGELGDWQALLFEVVLRLEFGHEHHGSVPEPWEGMARVDGQGSDEGHQIAVEVIANEVPLGFVQVFGLEEIDPLGIEQGFQHLMEEAVLPGRQRMDAQGDSLQELARGMTIGPWLGDSGVDLAPDSGHPDHEKFVPVAGDNGQELDPLQEGNRWVLRFLQDSFVERQPAQLAVQDLLRLGVMSAHGIIIGQP